MATLNGFDAIAKIYDQLAWMVFGRSIRNAQLHFISRIPADSNILIVGGGTGWILNEILKINPTVKICYVEASARMIALSKKATIAYCNIHFVHGTEEQIPIGQNYDVVITNFYLDLFRQDKLSHVIKNIKLALKDNHYWFVTDFVNEGKWWQILLLKLMYWFFKTVSKINSTRLPDWNSTLQKSGMNLVTAENFYGGFIKSAIYKPTDI